MKNIRLNYVRLESVIIFRNFIDEFLVIKFISMSSINPCFSKIRSLVEEDKISDYYFCSVWFCSIIFLSNSCSKSTFDINKFSFYEKLFTSFSEDSPRYTTRIFSFIYHFASSILDYSISSNSKQSNFFIIFNRFDKWISSHISY